MKLLFDLSPADSAVLEAERGPDERVMVLSAIRLRI